MNPLESVLEFIIQLFRLLLQLFIDLLTLVIGFIQSILHMLA